MSNKPKRERKPFRVWCAVTVFVQGEGERNPWTKRSRGQAVTVQGVDFDHAMQVGERELARQMAERFGLVGSAK
jgi:hypothetical protein